MKVLDLCAACHCYVEHREPSCPFCGAIARRQVVPRFAPRMNRGRWAALGSTLTLMSCTDSGTPASSGVPDATGRVLSDAGPDVARDSESDSGVATVDSGESDGDARVVDANDDRSSDVRADVYQDVGRDGWDGEFDVRIDASADASRDAIDDADLDARRDRDTSDASPGDTRDVVADASDIGDGNPDVSVDHVASDRDDDAAGDAGLFVCTTRLDGATLMCDQRTQVCRFGAIDTSCTTYDGGALGELPANCMPEAGCACLLPYVAGCLCREDNGAFFISCNACYGCPPPRYEKTPMPALAA